MLKSLHKIFSGRHKASLVLLLNNVKENLFLSLLFVAFLAVGAEYATDMANESGEISFFYEVLEDSQTSDNFSYLDYLKADLPVIGFLHTYNHLHQEIPFTTLHAGRAPPIFNS